MQGKKRETTSQKSTKKINKNDVIKKKALKTK